MLKPENHNALELVHAGWMHTSQGISGAFFSASFRLSRDVMRRILNHLNRFHPAILFGFFTIVIAISMVSSSIEILVLCFIFSLVLKCTLQKGVLIKSIAFAVLVFASMLIFNALFMNSDIKHMLQLGFILTSVLNWFSSYNLLVTSDKFLFLFARFAPTFALLFSMTMGFVPKFEHTRDQAMSFAKCIGMGIYKGQRYKESLQNGARILLSVLGISLELAIHTSDSMRNRGYGLKNKTSFAIYKFSRLDAVAAVYLLAGSAGFTTASILNIIPVQALFSALIMTSPVIFIFIQEVLWKSLTSKISNSNLALDIAAPCKSSAAATQG